MPADADRKIVLVTRRTRLEELVAKYHTLAQAKFYVEHLGADFSDYQKEHETYLAQKRRAVQILEDWGRYQIMNRDFLPSFIFGPSDIVVALGQDGLVANTMKYLDGHPLIGVNPDVERHDGVLLPFVTGDLPLLLREVAADKRPFKTVTMAKAALTDGQTLHAVNDLFIGARSHTSAFYQIGFDGRTETQSSSGLIVSTGLGSTAWFKSIVIGSLAIAGAFGGARASRSLFTAGLGRAHAAIRGARAVPEQDIANESGDRPDPAGTEAVAPLPDAGKRRDLQRRHRGRPARLQFRNGGPDFAGRAPRAIGRLAGTVRAVRVFHDPSGATVQILAIVASRADRGHSLVGHLLA